MFIQFTEKQYKLFVRIMQVMQVFYDNDFSSICKEVGETYGAKKADIENAYTILTEVRVTGPVPAMQKVARKILDAALSAVDIKSAVRPVQPTNRMPADIPIPRILPLLPWRRWMILRSAYC